MATAATTMHGYSLSNSKLLNGGSGTTEAPVPLSLRGPTILMWMLLVELLRTKVETILVIVGMQSYTSTIDRASRIAWLGYLVFYSLSSTGKKAIYGTLWVLATAKLLQRVAINELLKRSFAFGRNAEQLGWYMDMILRRNKEHPDDDSGPAAVDEAAELLKRCKYAVMGEEELETTVSSEEGCHLEQPPNKDDVGVVTTVGDIWADKDKDELLRHDPSLKRLCLSFALHKLLRWRLEDHPITDEEASSCRSLIFRGLRGELLHLHGVGDALTTHEVQEQRKEGRKAKVVAALALFQVFDEEIHFLCEYYHSVIPVVLSNPFFFFANYIFFPIVVWGLCLLAIILCAIGDLACAYRNITTDNYFLSTGSLKLFGCLLTEVVQVPEAVFKALDVAVTMLLLLTFVYEEVWEFLVFILSGWLTVSLLCEYTAKHRWRESCFITGLIRRILLVRQKLSRPKLAFKQLSLLSFLGRLSSLSSSMALALLPGKKAAAVVPIEVKKSIVEYLVSHVINGGDTAAAAPLSNGWSTLRSEKHKHSSRHDLWKVCESKSLAEVILTWHIATSMLEVKYPLEKKARTPMGAHRQVATVDVSLLTGDVDELLSSLEGRSNEFEIGREQLL